MGAKASFEMEWSWTLDKKFIQLKFKNERTAPDNERYIFEANAYYRLADSVKIEGMWFDSRGIYFPLGGTVTCKKLIVKWGSPETEQGKTVYNLINSDEINVVDYILKNGEYKRFGTATYK